MQPGQPEVDDHGLIPTVDASDQHVAGLEITMDEPLVVGGCEPAGDLCAKLDRVGDRQGAPGCDPILQPRPLDELHDEVEFTVVVSEVDDANDVWMVDATRETGFAPKPMDGVVAVCDGRVQHLEGDGPVDAELGRTIDDAVASATDGRVDPKPPIDDRSNVEHAAPTALRVARSLEPEAASVAA